MSPSVDFLRKVPGQCHPSRNSFSAKVLRHNQSILLRGDCPILGLHVPRMERRAKHSQRSWNWMIELCVWLLSSEENCAARGAIVTRVRGRSAAQHFARFR